MGKEKIWDKLDYLNLYGIDLDNATITYAADIDSVFSLLMRIKIEILKKYWKEELKQTLREVNLILCSPGGDANSLFSVADMYDFYEKENIKINVLVEGICYSAATFIIGNASGKRRATKRTRFMIHELQISSLEGTATQTKSTQKEIDFIQEEALRFYCELYIKKNFNSPLKEKEEKEVNAKIDYLMKKETYLSAQEALEIGLIDEII